MLIKSQQSLLLLYLNDNYEKSKLNKTKSDGNENYTKNFIIRKEILQTQKAIQSNSEITQDEDTKPIERFGLRLPSLKEFKNDLEEKGIDMEASFDMATLAMQESIKNIVVVTKNTDFIPALKFVRMCGIRIILDTLGNKIHKELIDNSDIIINSRKLFLSST